MTDEVMMVPVQEFKRLQDYYKGQMTENGLLDKAGRLAAKEHLILKDKRIPDSMVVKITKPLSSEQGRLVKHLHTSKTGPLTLRGTKEPKGMVDALMETRPSLKRVPLHRVSRLNSPHQALKKEKKKSQDPHCIQTVH